MGFHGHIVSSVLFLHLPKLVLQSFFVFFFFFWGGGPCWPYLRGFDDFGGMKESMFVAFDRLVLLNKRNLRENIAPQFFARINLLITIFSVDLEEARFFLCFVSWVKK